MKQINLLDKDKYSSWNIPISILKAIKEVVCPYPTDSINSTIYDYKFPNELEEADLSPLFNNDDSTFTKEFERTNQLVLS